MKLTDLQPLAKWAALEAEIHRRSGMRARVYDVDGIGITDQAAVANDLCREIRSTSKGLTFICAIAHQNLAAMAQNTRAPVIEECDAGMIKIVVPIFANGEFVGAAGGCGRLLEGGEVDDFMIDKTTGIAEARVNELARQVEAITPDQAQALADFIAAEIRKLVGS
jgi:ligand-binding sensor protein